MGQISCPEGFCSERWPGSPGKEQPVEPEMEIKEVLWGLMTCEVRAGWGRVKVQGLCGHRDASWKPCSNALIGFILFYAQVRKQEETSCCSFPNLE